MAIKKDGKRVPLTTTIGKDTKEKLDILKDEVGLSNSKIIDLAIQKLYEEYQNDGIMLKISKNNIKIK
ncbi:MAG: hypothetical protein ACRC30_08350 [Clostridium sp.]